MFHRTMRDSDGRARSRAAKRADRLTQRSRRRRLTIEGLEDRVVLSTIQWNSAVAPAGGLWSTPSNWVGNVVPGANDDAVIDLASTGTVTMTSGASIRSLAADVDTTLALNGGAFSIAANSTIAGTLALSGGTISGAGKLTSTGAFNWTGGTLAGSVTNAGSMTIAAGGGYVFLAGTLTNAGTIAWTSGMIQAAPSSTNATLVNQAGAVFEARFDGSINPYNSATITVSNAGTFRKSAGAGTTTIAVPFNNTGGIEIVGGTLSLPSLAGSLSGSKLTGGFYLVKGVLLVNADIRENAATIILDGAGARITDPYRGNVNALANLTTNAATGSLTLRNGPSLNLPGAFVNYGNLTVGAGSTISAIGFTQTASALLNIELGGPPSSGQFGYIFATGIASLAGALNVGVSNGFGPTIGQSFKAMSFGSRVGSFETINGLNYGRTPWFQANLSSTALDIQSVATAADLAVKDISFSPTGVPGRNLTLGYTIENRSDQSAVDSWVDSIYLSSDDKLDATDLLVGRVSHDGGLTGHSSYLGTLTVPMPAASEGNFRFIVVADSRGLVPDANRGNNTVASSSLVNLQVPVLADGQTITGTIANGQDIYYRLNTASGGDASIQAQFTTSPQAEFYARFGALPDRSHYDFVASSLFDLNQKILLSGTPSGSYYILLHGREGAAGGKPFSLTAQVNILQLQGVTPNQGNNSGQATVTLKGTGFGDDAVVSLVSSLGGTTRPATKVGFQNRNTLFATFDLTGLAPGRYDVRVVSGGQTTTSAGAYNVQASQNNPGRIVATISSPQFVRPGLEGSITVN